MASASVSGASASAEAPAPAKEEPAAGSSVGGAPAVSIPSAAVVGARPSKPRFVSKYFRPPKPYTDEQLTVAWRLRDAQLLRVLSARNLDGIKSTFDRSFAESGKEGLTAVEFVAALLDLLGHLMVDKQEFCIQILELFAAIDVRCALAFALRPGLLGAGWRLGGVFLFCGRETGKDETRDASKQMR